MLEVQRHGDPIWNGTLIGAAVGLVLSPVSAEACLDGSRLPCVLRPMAAYGAIGALWDRLHVGRQTIYRRPPTTSLRVAFVPVISPHVQGFGVRWSF